MIGLVFNQGITLLCIYGLRESGVEAHWLLGEICGFSIVAVMAVSMRLRRACPDILDNSILIQSATHLGRVYGLGNKEVVSSFLQLSTRMAK